MHWIIQSNLVADADVQRLREALDRLDTPYTDVKLIPIVRQLDHVPQVEGPVFVYGTTYIHRGAYEQNWTPGYVGGKVDYQAVSEGYGEQMLNSDATYSTLRDLVIPEGDILFVRPDNDGKLFTGVALDQDELNKLREIIVGQQGTDAVLDERVVVSSPKKILSEVRCLVVDGQVVGASFYRRGGQVFISDQVDQAVIDYAQEQVDRFSPDLGYALDVADTPEGFRIIEINALSSCGLYACDLYRFVVAVNNLAEKVDLQAKPARSISP